MAVRDDPARAPGVTEVRPDGWPRGAGYAHATAARGRLVSVAGQIGWDPRTMEWRHYDLIGQTGQTLRNVVEVVQAAGGSASDVVRLTWYILDRGAYLDARREIGQAYREIFGKHFPAMTVIVVSALIEPEALVEIEATAVVSE